MDNKEAVQMTDKERADCYLEFYKAELSRFDERRKYEWKVNFAIWALPVIVIGLGLKGDLGKHGLHVSWPILLSIHILVLALYVYWTKSLHGRNDFDKRYAHAYKDAIETLVTTKTINLEPVALPKHAGWGILGNWAARSQMAFTFGLVSLSFLACLTSPMGWPQDRRTVSSSATAKVRSVELQILLQEAAFVDSSGVLRLKVMAADSSETSR